MEVRYSLSLYPALGFWGAPSGLEPPHAHHRTSGPFETHAFPAHRNLGPDSPSCSALNPSPS